jgi:hypothetical protein
VKELQRLLNKSNREKSKLKAYIELLEKELKNYTTNGELPDHILNFTDKKYTLKQIEQKSENKSNTSNETLNNQNENEMKTSKEVLDNSSKVNSADSSMTNYEKVIHKSRSSHSIDFDTNSLNDFEKYEKIEDLENQLQTERERRTNVQTELNELRDALDNNVSFYIKYF